MTDCYVPKFETLTGVGIYILQLAAQRPGAFREGLRYSPLGAVKRVCEDRRSVASCSTAMSSFLWGSIVLNEDGEPTPEWDYGKMPYEVGVLDNPRRRRINVAAYEAIEIGAERLIPGFDHTCETCWEFCYRNGIELGQPFLAEVSVDWWQDYYGEADSSVEFDLLWLSPPARFPHLPIITGKLGSREHFNHVRERQAKTKVISVENGDVVYKSRF